MDSTLLGRGEDFHCPRHTREDRTPMWPQLRKIPPHSTMMEENSEASHTSLLTNHWFREVITKPMPASAIYREDYSSRTWVTKNLYLASILRRVLLRTMEVKIIQQTLSTDTFLTELIRKHMGLEKKFTKAVKNPLSIRERTQSRNWTTLLIQRARTTPTNRDSSLLLSWPNKSMLINRSSLSLTLLRLEEGSFLQKILRWLQLSSLQELTRISIVQASREGRNLAILVTWAWWLQRSKGRCQPLVLILRTALILLQQRTLSHL